MEKIENTTTLLDPIKINYFHPDSLLLDAENPRFAGLIDSKVSNNELLKKLRKEMYLDELIDSFRENGYYNTEPLLAIKSNKDPKKFIIIEGNRRLAAIKLLLTDEFKGKVDKKIIKQLSTEIPVAVYPSRKTLWTYLGFRHINGPKEWDSYSKAVYALTVHVEYKIPIKDIADKIGDKNQTVVKMCNGLRLLQQAEKQGYFSSEDVDLKRFYFSHLYTIIQKNNTKSFLGLPSKTNEVFKANPVSKSKIKNLQLLLNLLFGSKDGSVKPVIKSQNPDLRNLDEIIGNKKALKYLTENKTESNVLDNALSFTGSEESVLESLMFKSLNTLRKASGMLYSYKGDDETYKEAKEIETVANYIVAQMEIKRKKK